MKSKHPSRNGYYKTDRLPESWFFNLKRHPICYSPGCLPFYFRSKLQSYLTFDNIMQGNGGRDLAPAHINKYQNENRL